MTGELVTVVVPVYKTEAYLNRCVESIVNQTYPNLDILLIDDGSPDRCPGMCDGWARKDSRIRVIHKENAGLGMARNTGIDHARGEYICFADSDDFLVEDAVEQAVLTARKDRAELVIFGMGEADKEGNILSTNPPSPDRSLYIGEQVRTALLPGVLGPDPGTGTSFGLAMSACCVLISMALIRRTGWRFVSEREILSEDIYSMLALYRHVDRASVLAKNLYFYRRNNSSLSRSYREDRFLRAKHCYLQLLELGNCCGYNDAVLTRCAEPFISSVFAALKGEVLHCGSYLRAREPIGRILKDDVLKQVLQEHAMDRMGLKRRLFYRCMGQERVFFCYALLRVRLWAEMGRRNGKKP